MNTPGSSYKILFNKIKILIKEKLSSGIHLELIKNDLENIINKHRKMMEGYDNIKDNKTYISDEDVSKIKTKIINDLIDDPLNKYKTIQLNIGPTGSSTITLENLIEKCFDDLTLKKIDGANMNETIEIVKRKIADIIYKEYNIGEEDFKNSSKTEVLKTCKHKILRLFKYLDNKQYILVKMIISQLEKKNGYYNLNKWKFYNSKNSLVRHGQYRTTYERMMIPPWLQTDTGYEHYISLVFSQKGGKIAQKMEKIDIHKKKRFDKIKKVLQKKGKNAYYVLNKNK